MTKTALVTGANRGIGKQVAQTLAEQGMQVILTSRDETQGQAVVDAIKANGGNAHCYKLDVTNLPSVTHFSEFIREHTDKLDVIVNNAGVLLEDAFGDKSFFDKDFIDFVTTMNVNVMGPIRICHELIPLMQGEGHIINVSSRMGQFESMNKNAMAYRISKAALNAFSKTLQDELASTNIAVNSICPGWIHTDMGGAKAPGTVEQGADTIVWLATQDPKNAPHGKFVAERKEIAF